ncbi:MAG: hypothetical protein VB137_01260 [Burkholderia sp.]
MRVADPVAGIGRVRGRQRGHGGHDGKQRKGETLQGTALDGLMAWHVRLRTEKQGIKSAIPVEARRAAGDCCEQGEVDANHGDMFPSRQNKTGWAIGDQPMRPCGLLICRRAEDDRGGDANAAALPGSSGPLVMHVLMLIFWSAKLILDGSAYRMK